MTVADTIKNTYNCREVLRLHGIHLNGSHSIECPLPGHDETEPSFRIYDDNDSFYCFGCKRGGDSITLHSLLSNSDNSEAFKDLAQKIGVNLTHEEQKDYQKLQNQKTDIQKINSSFQSLCINSLKSNPEVQEFCLRKWGFDWNILERYGIGYCSKDVYAQFRSIEKGYVYLAGAGLLRLNKSGNHWRVFQDRVVIPYFGLEGFPVYFIGRSTPFTAKFQSNGKEVDPPKYFKTLVKSDKNPDVLECVKNQNYILKGEGKDLYITEGIADAISLHYTTGKNVISPGTTTFKKHDIDKIVSIAKRYNRAIIVNDNEENRQGEKGALSTYRALREAEINALMIELPRPDGVDKVDVNDFFKTRGHKPPARDDFLSLPKQKFFEILVKRLNPDKLEDEIEIVFAELIFEYGEGKGKLKARKLLAETLKIPDSQIADYLKIFDEITTSGLDTNKSKSPYSGDEVLPFPLEAMPEPLDEIIRQGSKSGGYPPDFIAIPMLTILGAAIGNKFQIELKKGWKQKANLYTAVVGQAGAGKSPGQHVAVKPVERKQIWAKEKFDLDMEKYEKLLCSFEEKKSRNKKSSSEEKPRKPILEEYYVNDTTVEALCKTLENNPRGLVVTMDELTAWVNGMNQYKGGRGNDREHYLSLWVNKSIKINRMNRTQIIREPFLAITGCLPPSVLDNLVDEKTQGEDGFVHRILFSYPDTKTLPWNDDILSPETENLYDNFYNDLLGFGENDFKRKRTATLPLSTDAYSRWVEFYNNNSSEMESSNFPGYLRGVWSKMPSQCARIALIIQICRYIWQDDIDDLISYEVDEESILRARAIIDYFKSHAARVYKAIGEQIDQSKYIKVLEWMDRRKTNEVSAREIQQAKFTRTSKEAQALLAEMEAKRFLKRKETNNKDSRGRGKSLIIYTRIQ